MKRSFLIILLSLLVGNHTAFCQAQSPISLEDESMNVYALDSSNIPKITGHLLNYSAISLDSLVIRGSVVILQNPSQKQSEAEIYPDGTFVLPLTSPLPHQQVWFSVGEFYFGLLLVKDSLHIIVDIAKLTFDSIEFLGEGVRFEGPDAEITSLSNRFIEFEREKQKDLYTRTNAIQPTMKSEKVPDSLIAELRSIFEEFVVLEKAFFTNNPSEFEWLSENERLSELYGKLCHMHWGKQIPRDLKEEILSHKPIAVSNSSTNYYHYLSTWASIQPNSLKKRNLEEMLTELSTMPKRKADILKRFILPRDNFKIEAYIDTMLPTVESPWVEDFFQSFKSEKVKEAQGIQGKLDLGNDSTFVANLGKHVLTLNPQTSFYYSTQTSFEEILTTLQEKYPGKALVFDLWTTWCRPCLTDMKNSTEVKKELKRHPVEIIYLCLDVNSSKEDWTRRMAELEIIGDHIFVEEALSKAIMDEFEVPGFPTYLFFNTKGEYVPNVINFMSRLDVEELKKEF
ncbi:MAG: thioredoxin-like domain-containing protein [Bacteroidota bacterium]